MKKSLSLVLIMLVSVVFLNCQNKKITSPSSSGLQSIYFDFDMSLIRSDAVAAMQGNAGYLKQNPGVSVTVEGNCDSRGTNEYNLALGQRRAQSAKDYLINLGVNSTQLNTASYGEEKPVCYQNNESCWQRNRRADFRR